MGVLSESWLGNEVLREFAAQMPENRMQQVVMIADDSDTVVEEFRQLGNDKWTVTNAGGLTSLSNESQDLVIVYKLASSVDLNNLLRESLRILKAKGNAIICEFMESLPKNGIADLSALFDSYSNSDKFFKLYCMNQFEDIATQQLGVYWILETLAGSQNDDDEKMTRSFLDQTQYTDENINAYEWIFGKDFISPGGIDQNRRILSDFDELAEGKSMLDIGCGIGGNSRQISRELRMKTLAVDISANMIAFAINRSGKFEDRRVRYSLADAVEYRFEPSSFDYAFSRDCVQHVFELQRLFKNIYDSLKPGGQFIVTMYGKGQGTLTDEFLQYVKDRKYTLRSLDEVIQMGKNAGFKEVEGENITKRFEEILHKERKRAIDNHDIFMERFSAKKYNALVDGWEQKLRFIAADNHNWLKIKMQK